MADRIFGNNVTTDQATTVSSSTFVTSNAALADSVFTNGADYVIIAQGILNSNTSNSDAGVRIVEDSSGTVLPKSTCSWRGELRGTERNQWPPFVFKWTAVSGEGLRIEHNNPAADANVYTMVESTLIAIRVDDLAAADFQDGEDANTTNLTVTPTTFATLTETLTTDPWLILGMGFLDSDVTSAADGQVDVVTSGGETETMDFRIEGVSATDNFAFPFMKAKAYTAASYTVDVDCYATAGTTDWSHEYSYVCAINLANAFTDATAERTTTGVTLSTADTAFQLESLSHAVSATGNCLFLGFSMREVVSTISSVELYFTDNDDSVDFPLTAEGRGVTAISSRDVNEELGDFVVAFRSLSTNPTTIDLDAYDNRQADAIMINRSLAVISFDAPAIGGGADILRQMMMHGH